MWPLLFHREHRQWLALCKAAENPHPQGVAEVARLLKAGACSDFPVSAAKALGDAQNTLLPRRGSMSGGGGSRSNSNHWQWQ